MGAKMTITLDFFGEIQYRFQKNPSGGTVNILNEEGVEVDMFTNYDIGSDFDVFEEACRRWITEAEEAMRG